MCQAVKKENQMSVIYQNRESGPKTIARRVAMVGHYIRPEKTARPPAKHVCALPGFDINRNYGCADIIQGIEEGIISPDATVWGVERDESIIPLITKQADEYGIDLRMHGCALKDFTPPHKLDMFIGDMMQVPGLWMGEYLYNKVVPHMKKRRSSISVNVCVQSIHTKHNADNVRVFKEMFEADPSAYLNPKAWDMNRPQCPDWAMADVLLRDMDDEPLARSVRIRHGINRGNLTRNLEDEGCFLAFVGIHHYMRHTDFRYRGCYLYRQASNTMAMLTLYYDRG